MPCGISVHRCVQEVDVARGIPCPSCSGTFRSEDKLLKEQEALPDWHVGDSLTSTSSSSVSVSTSGNASSSGSGGGGGGGGSGDSSRCGYIYCDMAAQLAGADAPWKCDVCGATVANDTAELWGRYVCSPPAVLQRDISSLPHLQEYILTISHTLGLPAYKHSCAVLHNDPRRLLSKASVHAGFRVNGFPAT